MKNLKKVLAMVLAFACTFSMFAGAKVFEDVPAGSDYSEAITMLSDLGVIQGKDDGKYHPEDTITRAEACAMIARLMTGDPNVSQYVGAQSFTDVAKGSWKDSAIGYCYINGIVIGVGDNKFEPDRAITDAEFITMVVRAMGYETADMKQNYPYSYMSNAQAIGLLDGTNMVASTDALRGEDAQVIYNALFTDYARGAKLVNTTHGTSVEQYPVLAEQVWGLTRAAVGTWDEKDDETATLEYCKAHTWVVLGADPETEGNIIAYPISDKDGDVYTEGKGATYSFKYDGDASAVAGYQVELWGEGSHGEPEWDNKADKYVWSDDWTIKAIKTVKGQTAYDYNASMADSKDDNGEIVLDETTLNLDAVAENAEKYEQKYAGTDLYVAKNYNGYKMDSDKNVEKALNVRDGAQYKLVDWDSDGDIDWVVVSEANYYKVESISSKRITVSYMDATNDEEDETKVKTISWDLDDTNDMDGYKLDVKGAEDLEEGDIIEVTYTVTCDDDDELVTANVAKVEAETLSLDKVSTKDNLVLTFDGETMELAQNQDVGDTIVPANPSKYAGFDEEELGTEFNIWTDRNGFIVYSDYATESTNYMMVLDTANGSDKTGDRKQAVIDFVSADNKLHKDVKLTTSARILEDDGRTEVKDTSGSYAYNDSTRKFNESLVVGNVYKYWTNEDGQITKMEEVVNDTKGTEYNYVSKNDRLTVDGSSYALEDADVIFAVIGDYIKEEKINGHYAGLKVNDSDVLAVKQSDIPDIKAGGDTEPEVLDTIVGAQDDSWITNDANDYAEYTVALSADKNKDVSAAVLGVDSFNKFNAGATKVGLVTNVSYDSKDVVSIDVAYNGKVETLSSAEKTDFDDVVSVLEYKGKNNTKEYSVGSRTENITCDNGILKGTNLKTYLNKSAAYAEVTVDADGKLTGVTFMDVKSDEDAAVSRDNYQNALIGNYYQVSRKVIADVNEGKWISTYNSMGVYADKDSFFTLDTKNGQTAVDLASDVAYYTIEGTPTMYGAEDRDYAGKAASVLAGFNVSPKIDVATSSDVEVSEVRNDAEAANDIYYVADVASKIDDNGKGDVTAVYMFEDEMKESIALDAGAAVDVKDIVVGEKAVVNVTLPDDDNLDTDRVYVEVDGKKFDVKDGANTIDLGLKAGTYTIKLYGYNTANKADEELASDTFEVKTSDVTTLYVESNDLTIKNGTSEGSVVIKTNSDITGADAASVKILDKNGVDVTDKFDVTPNLNGDGTITIKGGDKAGTYTAKVTKAGYNFNDVTFEVVETVKKVANVVTTNQTPGNDVSNPSTVQLRVNGASANVTYTVNVKLASSDQGSVEVVVTDEVSESELAGLIAKAINADAGLKARVVATQGASDNTFTVSTVGASKYRLNVTVSEKA
ncbi:S-layer homology domain-containing protein [Butyricicoccus pullicaecorum]|uniref:S-layer homology domain-containing protein n=1 Tax=Butyricicoccus pullicaecorum TaxID=501571 RepID=UPI003990733B